MQNQINETNQFNQFASSYNELLQLIIDNKIESEVFNVTDIQYSDNLLVYLTDNLNNEFVALVNDIDLIDENKYRIASMHSQGSYPKDEIEKLLNVFIQSTKNLEMINFSKNNKFHCMEQLDDTLTPIYHLLEYLYDKIGTNISIYNEYIIKLAEYMWNNKIPFRYKENKKSDIEKAERKIAMLDYLDMYEKRNISRKEFLSYIETNIYRSEDEKRIEELTKEREQLFNSLKEVCKSDDINN